MAGYELRILLVDDDEDDYVLVRDLLSEIEDWKFDLEWAATYAAALEAIRRNQHDVCLIDYRLGAHDGLELLRRAGESGSRAPMIFLTGQGGRKIDVEAMKAGAADYLVKEHLDSSLLERSIRYAVERAQVLKALRKAREELETRVYERTVELTRTNEALQTEIAERRRAEREVHTLNAELERRVIERTAQLEAANKELEAFSYSVSHDLRAPLRSIDGFSRELLTEYADRLNEQGKSDLQRVRAASQRMGQLIDDMLKLSRLSRSEMRPTTVDMSALAQAIATDLQKTQPERRVEFNITSGLVVNADADLLRIALENLMENAWKFTGKRAQARVELGVTEQEGRSTYFVRDNGAGFDMAFVDKLFGAFQRLHGGKEFEGTGIGLATIQRIIHRHGGRVWAEAEVDKGATFYFTI